MAQERRQHRTPFKSEAQRILDASGKYVAICETHELARWLCTTANFFDRLSAAVRVCKGEHENQNGEIQMTPAYQELVRLVNEYEEALRGNHK
jgi:hypothetical protein